MGNIGYSLNLISTCFVDIEHIYQKINIIVISKDPKLLELKKW